METFIQILIFISLVGSGFMAGVLYAFSTTVMAALATITPAEGIRAMQAINRIIINPLFIGSFIGTAIASLALVILGFVTHLGENELLIMVASLLYALGTFLVTVAGNVPMNNKLDTVDPESGNEYWQFYLQKWTRLNHFRTLCAIVACALFTIAIL